MIDIHSEEYILGQNIRKYRMQKGWSQMDLSKAVDIDRADISKYENGTKGEMGFRTLKRFASALGMGTADIRYRAEFPEWSATLTIRYNPRAISAEQIVNLLNFGGFSNGLGEWRPEKDGDHGTFHVAFDGE